MVNRFPNELIDCILDNLYFDKFTLLNCALVGRAWVRSSQRGIFREIILTSWGGYRGDYANSCVKFVEQLIVLFDASPHLASYVQYLELRRFSLSIPETLKITAAAIIRRLSNIEKLSLYGVDWARLSPSLRESLTDVLRAPSLTHLSLIEFGIPSFIELTSLLGQTRRLKSLVAHSLFGDWKTSPIPDSLDQLKGTGTTITSVSPPQSTQLRHLCFRSLHGRETYFMTWFRHKSCPFRVENISSLEICRNTDSAVLRYLGAHLRELKIELTQPDQDFPCDYLNYTPPLTQPPSTA